MLEIVMFSSLGLALAIVAPLLVLLAYRNWRKIRNELPQWRNVAGRLAMLLALFHWTWVIIALVALITGSPHFFTSALWGPVMSGTLIAGVLLPLTLKGPGRVQLFAAAVILVVGITFQVH